jgi:hypothetical protein
MQTTSDAERIFMLREQVRGLEEQLEATQKELVILKGEAMKRARVEEQLEAAQEEVRHWKYDHQEASKERVARAERAEEQLEAAGRDLLSEREQLNASEAERRTCQRILAEERRWIADARDWYRDHRSSKGGIYDENTWGDPFAVPGEAGALPPSAVPSGADVSPPVSSPEPLVTDDNLATRVHHAKKLLERGDETELISWLLGVSYDDVKRVSNPASSPADGMLRHGDGTPYMHVSDYFEASSEQNQERDPATGRPVYDENYKIVDWTPMPREGSVECRKCGAVVAWEGEPPEDCLRCGAPSPASEPES